MFKNTVKHSQQYDIYGNEVFVELMLVKYFSKYGSFLKVLRILDFDS